MTFAFLSPSSRTARSRKPAFLSRRSRSVTVAEGQTAASGIPGNPAPLPTSSTEAGGRSNSEIGFSESRMWRVNSVDRSPFEMRLRRHACS